MVSIDVTEQIQERGGVGSRWVKKGVGGMIEFGLGMRIAGGRVLFEHEFDGGNFGVDSKKVVRGEFVIAGN